jgi:hypothetical protein
MIGVLVSSVTMIGYMGVKQGIVQTSFILPIPVIMYHYWGKTLESYEKLATDMAYSRAVQADFRKEEVKSNIFNSFSSDFYTESSLKSFTPLTVAPYRIPDSPIILRSDGSIHPDYYEPQYVSL